MSTLTFGVKLSTIDCPVCGGVFAIAENYKRTKIEQGGGVGCPYCRKHIGWWQSENDKLNKELARKTAELDQANAHAEHLANAVIAHKAETTKVRNQLKNHERRAAHGVCPRCHRTFKQLAAHMKCKHPEFVAKAEGADQ